MSKRKRGAGTIVRRGNDSWRVRYRVNGERHSETVKGTMRDAQRRLREVLKSADDGDHAAPDKQTVAAWCEHWISLGAPGRRRKPNAGRTIDRYQENLDHVLPMIAKIRLQSLSGADVDRAAALEGKLGDVLRPRDPTQTSVSFLRQARRVGVKARLVDLRGTHESHLIADGVPVTTVARYGHSAEMLLRRYGRSTRSGDDAAVAAKA